MIKKFEEYTKDIEESLNTELSEEDMMFEMANLPPKRTGLKYQIWYSAKVEEHNPKINVDLGDGKSLSIQIETHEVKGDSSKIPQKELNDIFKWIDINKEILLKYWNDAHKGKIDNIDVAEIIFKI